MRSAPVEPHEQRIARPEPRYTRLSRGQELAILKHSAEGKTQTAIAHFLGLNQSTVSRVLSAYEDTRDLAKLKLNQASIDLAERAIKEADVDQALELLDRLDVAPKRQQQTGQTGITITLGMAQQVIGPDPMQTLTAQIVTKTEPSQT